MASKASNIIASNLTTYTKRINKRRSIVLLRIVKIKIKQQRTNFNTIEEDLQTT